MSARRGPTAPWPRPRRVRPAGEVEAGLQGVTLNGLRNIYRLGISALPPASCWGGGCAP